MKELLCIGEEIFEVEFCEDGVWIKAIAMVNGERKEGGGMLWMWDGLWNHKGRVATFMKSCGFIIKHPIKFNRLFRKYLSKLPHGQLIVDEYNEELEWKRKLRDWKKK